jgi:uncharacterized repeat protein (TIGR01451 family)
VGDIRHARGRVLLLLSLVAIAVSTLFGQFTVARAAGATAVCGNLPAGTTTWDATGSPFQICASGVSVPAGSTLLLDGSKGPVSVTGDRSGGLEVLGSLQTTGTGPASPISFDGPNDSPGSWPGINLINRAAGNPPPRSSANAALSWVSIDHARTAVAGNSGQSVSLDHVTISQTSDIAVQLMDLTVSITNSSITGAGRSGLRLQCAAGTSGVITGTTIDSAAEYGIDAGGCAPLSLDQDVISHSGVTGTRFPAAYVDQGMALGVNVVSLGALTGAGNGIDAIVLNGTIQSDLTWVTPQNSTATHPLGYVAEDLKVDGAHTLTIPAGAVVKGGPPQQQPDLSCCSFGYGTVALTNGATLDATQGGATFTSLSDNASSVPLCPSILVRTCTPQPGDFGGIAVFPGSTANLVGSTIRYAAVGVSGIDGPYNLSASSTLFDRNKDGIWADNPANTPVGSVNVTGSTFEQTVSDAVRATASIASFTGDTVTGAGGNGLLVGGTTVTVANNAVSGAAQVGIAVRSTSDPQVFANAISGTGTASNGRSIFPAMEVISGGMTLGPGGAVHDNTGSGNFFDAIGLGGTATSSVTWQTPTNANTNHALGYYVLNQESGSDTFHGGLTMSGPATLTLPANAVLKFEPGAALWLVGASMDARAGGATFTSEYDNSVGQPLCTPPAGGNTYLGCPADMSWSGIRLELAADGSRGNAAFEGATILHGNIDYQSGAASSPGSSNFGLVVDHSTVRYAASTPGQGGASSSPAIALGSGNGSTGNPSASITNSNLDHVPGGILFIDPPGNVTVTNNLLTNIDYSGFQWETPYTTTSSLGSNLFNRIGFAGQGAAITFDAGFASLTCESITGNREGLRVSGSNGTSISNSNVYGNSGPGRYDIDNGTGPFPTHANATPNWWGQATGPAAGQISSPATVGTTPFLAAPSTCTPAGADQGIDLSHQGDFTAGASGQYSITVTNYGPGVASPSVRDTLPPGLTFVAADNGAQWSCSASGQVVTCAGSVTLAPMETSTFHLNVSVSSSLTAGTITSSASLVNPPADPNPNNDGSDDPTTILAQADLGIAIAERSSFVQGQTGTFRISVTNLGPGRALPPSVSGQALGPVTGNTNTGTWTCQVAAGIQCQSNAVLDPGMTTSFDITFLVSWGGQFTASVSSPSPDPGSSNNTANDTPAVQIVANLGVTLSHSGAFQAGHNGTYVVTVTNGGPSSWEGVVIEDDLPTGFSFIAANRGNEWGCGASGQHVTCTAQAGAGQFAPGDLVPLELYVQVDAASCSANSTDNASVHFNNAPSNLSDPNMSNNSAADQTQVSGCAPRLPPPSSVASTQQYQLNGSDGVNWMELDPNLRLTISPPLDGAALLGGNADLWTANAGFNQDLGLFVSDNGGADQLVSWKESGGFAGTFSPNAAFVRATFHAAQGHTYIVKLKWKTNKPAPSATIFAGAGPINGQYSPTRVTAELAPIGSITDAASLQQYSLVGSDGSSWQVIDDAALKVTLSPTHDGTADVGANADLWTANAGFNQDLAIFVSTDGGPDQLLSWKESGGYGGTFSPNAAYVQGTLPITSGHTYVFRLEWKTNRPAPGAVIESGAGPIGGHFSPTRLTARTLDPSALASAVSTQQYSLHGSNGTAWQDVDPGVFEVTEAPTQAMTAVVGGNVDLWTASAGFNQDIAVFVSDNGGPDQLLAWKESGGFAGTASPNAAFVQAVLSMTPGHTYQFKLKWKANRSAPSATIYAGAGPISNQFSPSRLVVAVST